MGVSTVPNHGFYNSAAHDRSY